MSSCGRVTFAESQVTITGALTATGFITSPKTGDDVVPLPRGVILGEIPISALNANSWSGCLPGTIVPTSASGAVVYTLEASGSNGGDVSITKLCALVSGSLSCLEG